jgi:hypothetical protein
MVLTRDELIQALQQEVRILLHLAGKVRPEDLDYRPTAKQRSTLELLRYMAIMGPTQLAVIKANGFNRAALSATWSPAEAVAKTMTCEQAVAAIAAQAGSYVRELGTWRDEDFRAEIDVFGRPSTRGAMVVSQVLGGHAAYRTQLFLYLKSCGHDELGTMNLWGGADMPPRPPA